MEEREIGLSMTKDEFLNHLREVHIEGWKSKYINSANFAELEKVFGITA